MLILASASPRRKEILEAAGFTIKICVSNFDEVPQPGEAPADYSLRNAEGKAKAVAAALGLQLNFASDVVLGADTIVVTSAGVLLEKPSSTQHAEQMLRMLSGATHTVFTSYALVRGRTVIASEIVPTDVTFRILSATEISRYVATGEPMDKAGSYGIQGGASCFVSAIKGTHTNVMGLPIAQIIEKCAAIGILDALMGVEL